MRKLAVLGLAGLMATALPVSGSAAPGKSQTVDGSVALRAVFPADTNSCFAGAHRRGAVVTSEQNNGVVGYHFDVDKKSWKKPFTLEVTGGQAAVDLDIVFYPEFGTTEQATDTAYSPPYVTFEERGPGGEKGKVPKGMNKAIVCMYDGVASTFTYTAKLGK